MKNKLISALIGITMFGSGVLTANTWNGTTTLTETQAIAREFNEKAQQYIDKAKELEQLATEQNTDIKTLVSKVGELKIIKSGLETQVNELQNSITVANEKTQALETKVTTLTEQLTNANNAIDTANNEVETHKDTVTNLLNTSVFAELNIPDDIEISDALKDSTLKYNYEIDTTALDSNKQAEGKIKAVTNIIPYIESIDLLDSNKSIKRIKITVSNPSDYSYNVVVYTDSSNEQTLQSKLNSHKDEASSKYKINSLTVSVEN